MPSSDDRMNILVTGGAGFIGSHVVEALLDRGHEVTVVDNFNDYYHPAYKRQNLHPLLHNQRLTLVEGDIIDKDLLAAVFEKTTFDNVIHLAASVGVRNSLERPDLYRKNNVGGTQ